MEISSSNQERTATDLHVALAALDAAMLDVDELQKKFESISSRMDTLLVNTTKSPSANLGASLRSLNARSEVTRKALDRARRAYASARRQYHQASQRYAEHHELSESRLDRLQGDLTTAERCKGALARTIDAILETDESSVPSVQDRQTLPGHEGSYGYIPINTARFFDLLIALEQVLALDPDYDHPTLRYRPVSFLDVGCGTGRNLVLARSSGILELQSVSGFDIAENQIAAGKAQFGLDDELTVDDAMTFDFAAYDIIFSFRPFYDQKKMAEYEKHMVNSMRRSAYLVAVLSEDLSRFPELTCISPSLGIWKKSAGI